jgi:hypothetical protein
MANASWQVGCLERFDPATTVACVREIRGWTEENGGSETREEFVSVVPCRCVKLVSNVIVTTIIFIIILS